MRSRTFCVVAVLAVAAAVYAQPPGGRVKMIEEEKALRIEIDGQPFTTYRFAPTPEDPKWDRPYFYPVLASDGVAVTSDQYRLSQQEKTDHPHHRSIWVGHGNVNGVDHWLLGTPQQRHVRFCKIEPNLFVEELTWDGKGTEPVLKETRTVKVIAYDDGARGVEITSVFSAVGGAVEFKCRPLSAGGVEAGLCSVRLAKGISKSPEATVTNSAGKKGEKACRSEPADWCDYSGTMGGKVYGVAMLNDPLNPAGVTAWHVRQGGYVAHIGPMNWTLEKDRPVTFRHLVVIHTGGAGEAKLAEKYKQFTTP